MRFEREGFAITVGLRIDSGSVMGVDLVVFRPGWPELELRRETEGDVRAKQSGMNVEVQTGDPEFDRYVYLESPYGQAVLAPMLGSPELRRVLGTLLSQYGPITFSPREGLSVATREPGRALLDPARFMPFYDLVLRAARMFPPIAAGAPKNAERGGTLVILSFLPFVLGCILLPILRSYGEPEHGFVRPACAAAGLLVALALAPLVKRWVRGHSRSAIYFIVITIGSVIGLPILTMSVVVAANAALDPSPSKPIEGRLGTARNYIDDGEAKVDATIAWSDGTKEERTLADSKPNAQPGDRVEIVRRDGALGITWIERGPTVLPAKR